MFSLLHIDQNFFYKEILSDISKAREFQYYSAKNVEKAFEILNKYHIDIIITNLGYEDCGEELIKQILDSKHQSTPVVVLTATENPALKTRLLELGVTEYLNKDRFLDYLNAYLNRLQNIDALSHQLKNIRIAVLDDNQTQLADIQSYLENNQIDQADFYIHPAALIASQKFYHIYIIDLITPDISGEEVIAAIRGRDKYAVIIALSSIDSTTLITDVLALGADDYIKKPVSERLFMARLKASVRTYSLMEELKEKNMRLELLIKEDGLTGLYNHKSIIEALNKEIDRASRYDIDLAIIMFDIDRFKQVNDTYGHHVGDEVLEKVGNYLLTQSRDFDLAGRYGGEEFIMILPETNLKGAILYANRIRKAIESLTFSGADLKVTISGGISMYNHNNAVELIKEADTYLYQAKDKGRNRIEFE